MDQSPSAHEEKKNDSPEDKACDGMNERSVLVDSGLTWFINDNDGSAGMKTLGPPPKN